MYVIVDHRACLRAFVIGDSETAHNVRDYLTKELHVGMSNNIMR